MFDEADRREESGCLSHAMFHPKRPPFKAAFRHFKPLMTPKMTLISVKVPFSSICDGTLRDAHLLSGIPEFLQVFFQLLSKSQ